MNIFCVFFLLILFGCGHDKAEQDSIFSPNSAALRIKYDQKLAYAKTHETKDGWLAAGDCDGMIWAGKYACGGGDVTIEAAEYVDQPGRFNRRPTPFCGPADGSSKTTWSRDMGIAGLIPYAWCKKDKAVIERHIKYGSDNLWKMGEPFADGRVEYTPSMIGILYEVVYALGGEDSPGRVWPSIYPAGQVDYEAHLQMQDIWIRGEVNQHLKTIDLLDISSTMYERVKEHVEQEPECPFFNYINGLYTGDLNPAVDLLLAQDHPKCLYVRSEHEQEMTDLSEWLYVAALTMKKLGEK